MSTTLEPYIEGEVAQIEHPVGARALGVRVKPIIRLGMGYRDQQRRGAPVKTDYFTVRGDDRAVAKFHEEYGEKPKSVEILLPSDIDVALTIQYRAFKGAAGGEGGTLVAVGHTNFALRSYCGGPDVLTVFNQDCSVVEVETLGLDANTRQPLDDAARDLGLERYTTLRAGLPKVLGFGSYFEITTKGKESTDNLWAKLRELYALFGPRVSFAMSPLLVLRSSTARPVITDKETKEKKRTKTTIYVLDVVVPETIDEMVDRLTERQKAFAPIGESARARLYGRELERPAAPAVDPAEEQALDGEYEEEPTLDGDGFHAPAGVRTPEIEAAEAAAALVIPEGQFKGNALGAFHEDKGDRAISWFRWALRNLDDSYGTKAGLASGEFRAGLWAYCRVYLPELARQIEEEFAAA